MSSTMLEELEMKEPTPSIAPSLYENAPYAKKWRVLLAVLLGATLIGVCVLGFYISIQARRRDNYEAEVQSLNASTTPVPVPEKEWRQGDHCISTMSTDTCPEDFRPLLVIGVDGLRPDKLHSALTPALSYLAQCGVKAESLVPVYPTTTFPNFYSIATGLYPESHGIIGNAMHEDSRNFTGRQRLNPQWWHGEPIWNTVMKQGKKSATYFWPGSDVLIQERYPTHYYPYRKDEPIEVRTAQVLDWLMLPLDERPHFLMVYFEKPMSAIQEFGPHSDEARHSLALVDGEVDGLMDSLYHAGVAHCLNVLVVSDHGAADANCGSYFYLESFNADIKDKARIYTGAVGRLTIKEGKGSSDDILSSLHCKNPKVRALPKRLLPRRYHYANSPRIDDIILDTKPHNRIVTKDDNYCKKGEHGFNNLEPSMQATFLGMGPDLKVGYGVGRFRNVELYNLMCSLIRVRPAPNNGTLGSLDNLLRQPPLKPPPAQLGNLLEEELLPPPEKATREGDGGEGAGEPECVCDYEPPPPPIEEETPALNVTVDAANATSSNATVSGNATEPLDYEDPPPASPSPPPVSEETEAEIQARLLHKLNFHTPWGSPGYSAPDRLEGKLKVLMQTNYAIGLHELMSLGIWVSYTLSNRSLEAVWKQRPVIPEGIEVRPEDLKPVDKTPACWRADPRLERNLNDQCQRLLTTAAYNDHNVTLHQLFPEEFETAELLASQGHLLSNMAPSRWGYQEGGRRAMVSALEHWAITHGAINVVHGPVFDYDLDGRQDQVSTVMNTVKPLVPSDYFFVVCSCVSDNVATCPANNTRVMAFVFPNTELEDNCFMDDEEYLTYHLTTVRDVELLTGLRFFRSTFVREALPLRTTQPTSIWPLPSSPKRTGKSNDEDTNEE